MEKSVFSLQSGLGNQGCSNNKITSPLPVKPVAEKGTAKAQSREGSQRFFHEIFHQRKPAQSSDAPCTIRTNCVSCIICIICVICVICIICVSSACNNPAQPKTSNDTTANLSAVASAKVDKHQTSTITTTRTAIDTSGYFIDLPSTHHIETQHGNDFNVYYFTPNDTLKNPGEAGFYIGPRPDANPPSSKYSVLEMDGEILGENHKWMEYTTQYYTQRETFIDLGNGSFIHAWCYSDDHDELERLFKMISTIGK